MFSAVRLGTLLFLMQSSACAIIAGIDFDEQQPGPGKVSASVSSGTGAGTGGGSATGPGAAGPGSAGSSGSGEAPAVDCSGAFGVPIPAFAETLWAGSAAITADELELGYVPVNAGEMKLSLATRLDKSQPFHPGRTLDELEAGAGCDVGEARWIDLTADGLHVYFSCGGYVRFADRPDRQSTFTVQPDTLDLYFAEDVRVDATERFLYSSDWDNDNPVVASRTSVSEPFGTPEPVLGLEKAILAHPAPAPDGLTLVGSSHGPEDAVWHLVQNHRVVEGAPFGAQEDVPIDAMFENPSEAEMTADCRGLYFTASVNGTRQTYVMRR